MDIDSRTGLIFQKSRIDLIPAIIETPFQRLQSVAENVDNVIVCLL